MAEEDGRTGSHPEAERRKGCHPLQLPRPEAQEGSHDDLVMGTAITYYIRDQQKTSVENTQSVVNENVFYSFDNDKKFKEDYGETIEVI